MISSVIYSLPHKINERLSVFDATIPDLQSVAVAAVTARNEATVLHPSNAPGTFSYMAGVAALRMAFLQYQDWKIARHNGAEAIENKRSGIIIMFQNVDAACGERDPNPISSKGYGVADLVANTTPDLFGFIEAEAHRDENEHVWFYCVSCSGDEVRAELSRPNAIRNGKFSSFAERIFIIQDSDWSPDGDSDNDSFQNTDDFDIPVSKK